MKLLQVAFCEYQFIFLIPYWRQNGFDYFSRMILSNFKFTGASKLSIYVPFGKLSASLCFMFYALFSNAQWSENTSPTYTELIAYYQKLDKNHKEIELYSMGNSDYGLPIYVCIVNGAQDSLKTFSKAKNETTILINNAIHPGEPDGVNACLIWIDNWIKNGKKTKDLPVIAIIPAYNVGGMFNRNSSSRANQDGPEEYGFRGNAQNLDLNRDFIKMDSENAYTFVTIYQALDPDVFVDTHVSNGADYQYTLTYIANMKERMSPSMRSLTYEGMLPAISKKLKQKKWDLFPYVELVKETPEEGIHAFNDLPRYAMGYAALFDAIGITIETHMLKPFPQRVQATHDMLDEMISWMSDNKGKIEKARLLARNYRENQTVFNFDYELTDKKDSILFKGFEFSNPLSLVTGLPRLKYHTDKPYEKFVPYFQTYLPKDSIEIPAYIILGSQNKEIVERLKHNGVAFTYLPSDTTIEMSSERLSEFKSLTKPYEGHFYHNEVKGKYEFANVSFKKGDIMIDLHQNHRFFILSSLISRAEDSYFRWNFFDSYLQQKEGFSPYVFEEKALEILNEKPWLKEELEVLKAANKEFRESSYEQLYFIYKNSDLFEESYYLVPVYMN